MTPVERYTRITTSVPDLPTAWAFVMDHLDSLGAHPSITITPVYDSRKDERELLHFDVALTMREVTA